MTDEPLPPAQERPRLVISLEDLDEGRAAAPAMAPPAAAPPPPLPPVSPPPAVPPARRRTTPQYTICAIRDVVEGRFGPEDGLLLPVPALETDTVLLEPRDGARPSRVLCNEVQVRGGEANRRLLRAPSVRAQVLLTDARLTVACSKYEKGGGWVGDPVSMLALNAGSKLLAAARRRGKMLVGQVRYPWIQAVYAQNKSGWSGSEMLRVVVRSAGESMRLELTFPKDVDATAVATDLIRRAARFRLAVEPGLEAEERARLTELADIAPLQWRPGTGEMAGVRFPSHWPAGEKSARFGLEGTER